MKSADSGVKFLQPGGELSEGKEGERQRGLRATYSRGGASIKAGSKGIEGGGGLLLGLGHRREKRLEIEDDRWGPRSVRGREKDRVPVREWLLGCGLDSLLGRSLSPGSNSFLFCYNFSPFLFLDFCLSFEIVLLFRFERKPS
jgi:hypothetical protein